MPKELVVWGGNLDGRNRAIVAAPTKKAAAEAIGVSLYEFNRFYGRTGNAEDIAQALSAPGTVFKRKSFSSEPWTVHVPPSWARKQDP
jgi:hypothetical protein